MDITEIQSRLAELEHLLPSQREWVERLLFQLAFNDVSYIEAVGAEGSGKSTLALTLAELFSEQYNVALVSGAMVMPELANQLMQQWFAVPVQADIGLQQQIAQQNQTRPLLVILDQAIGEPAVLTKYIRPLPCLVFNFCSSSMQRDGLTLLLGAPGTADAEQLLARQQLNPLEITKRLADADGNLHLLLQPATTQSAVNSASHTVSLEWPFLKAAYVGAAVALVLALSYVFWPQTADQQRQLESASASTPATSDVAQPNMIPPASVPADAAPAQIDTDDAVVMTEDLADISAVSELDPAGTEDTIEQEEQLIAETSPEQSVADTIESKSAEPHTVSESTGVASAKQPADVELYEYDEAMLLAIDNRQVALQLAVLSSKEALLRFKAVYPEVKPLVYQRHWQGKPQLVLMLAPFSSSIEAKQKLSTLPGALKQTGPFVKRLQSVHAEISAKALSQQSVVE